MYICKFNVITSCFYDCKNIFKANSQMDQVVLIVVNSIMCFLIRIIDHTFLNRCNGIALSICPMAYKQTI